MSIQCPACLTDNPDGAIRCSTCGYEPLDASSSSPTTTTAIYHLPPGVLLKQGHYEIERVLGEGGFGITYKGINRQNNTIVAIKELWAEKGARQNNSVIWPSSIAPKDRKLQITKFKLEASHQKQCQHPNIANVYECFEENNTAYITMDFIPGKSLFGILKDEGVLSENQVKKYFIQIAEALKVVHNNKFLHRDIKPDNILINNQDEAILIDFGATREFIDGLSGEMSQIVTPGYAPYEQYSYHSKRFKATDFYALCASMYELLTGELPIDAVERVNNLMQGDASDPLIPPRKLNPKITELIERVILTGMKINVGERFQEADELIDALKGRFIPPSQRKAQELVKQGKLAEAIQTYSQFLTSDPNNGVAAVELALVQIHVKDSEAEITAKKAVKLNPNDGRGYGVLGLVSCRKARWKEAVKHLQQAARLAPKEVWIQANLAWALGKTKNWQQAEVAVSNALKIDSNCTFALGIKAWIAAHQQQWKTVRLNATPAIFKAKQRSQQDYKKLQQWLSPLLIMAIEKTTITRQAKDVEKRVNEFIAQNPQNPWGIGFQGWRKGRQALWSEALTYFERANSVTNNTQWNLINHGITLEQLNDIPNAINIYQSCLSKSGDDGLLLFRLGTLQGKIGHWTKGLSHLEKAIQLKPDYAEAYHNKGWILLNIRNADNEVENIRGLLSAYSKAHELYLQQNKLDLAQDIQQKFQLVGIEL